MTTTAKHLIPTLLLVLTLGLIAEAQPGPGGFGRGRGMQQGPNRRGPQMGRMDREGPGPGPRQAGAPGMRIAQLLRQLDLTQDQHEAIRKILDAHKDAAQASQQAVQKARQSLHEAVTQEADDVSIRAIATTLAQAVGDQAIEQVAVTKEIKGVLTAEQKEKLAALIKQAPEDRPGGPRGRQGRMGRGLGNGPQWGPGQDRAGRPGRGFGNGPDRGPGQGPRQRPQRGPRE